MLVEFCRWSPLRFSSEINTYEAQEFYIWRGSLEDYSFHCAYVVSETKIHGQKL